MLTQKWKRKSKANSSFDDKMIKLAEYKIEDAHRAFAKKYCYDLRELKVGSLKFTSWQISDVNIILHYTETTESGFKNKIDIECKLNDLLIN